jgi:hypothetical protein
MITSPENKPANLEVGKDDKIDHYDQNQLQRQIQWFGIQISNRNTDGNNFILSLTIEKRRNPNESKKSSQSLVTQPLDDRQWWPKQDGGTSSRAAIKDDDQNTSKNSRYKTWKGIKTPGEKSSKYTCLWSKIWRQKYHPNPTMPLGAKASITYIYQNLFVRRFQW